MAVVYDLHLPNTPEQAPDGELAVSVGGTTMRVRAVLELGTDPAATKQVSMPGSQPCSCVGLHSRQPTLGRHVAGAVVKGVVKGGE